MPYVIPAAYFIQLREVYNKNREI